MNPVFAQDIENKYPEYYYDVLGNFSIGFLVPEAIGTNFIAEGYELWNGVQLEGRVYVNDKVAVGAQFQAFKGRVVDPTVVGALDATGFTHGFVFGSYNPFTRDNNMLLELALGAGYMNYRNEKEFQRFYDTGFSLMANATLSYRFTKWLGVYGAIQHLWDFSKIATANSLRNSYNSVSIITPSLGLRFYFL
ncbi:MAG: hypothetical protein AAGF77_04810 [Bacteroidota bacterium]